MSGQRERPILFSAPMVRALLDGRKTQTRRVVLRHGREEGRSYTATPGENYTAANILDHFRPPCEAGDRLWVRESHFVQSAGYADGRGRLILYRATEPDAPTTWTPSIHMPRWASRISLDVVAVRAERWQDITDQDALAEGVPFDGKYYLGADHTVKGTPTCWPDPRSAFASRWDALNAKRGYGWRRNPWVWAISFRVLPAPSVSVQPEP